VEKNDQRFLIIVAKRSIVSSGNNMHSEWLTTLFMYRLDFSHLCIHQSMWIWQREIFMNQLTIAGEC